MIRPILLITLFSISQIVPAALPTPEERARRLSLLLRPINDDQWKQIAGEFLEQEYQVENGDTLWDVSTRLFGEGSYWPKVWALNNGNITNPHVIEPGNRIAFMPGTTTSLPGVRVKPTPIPPSTTAPDIRIARGNDRDLEELPEFQLDDRMPEKAKPKKKRYVSQEWKLLPRQPWETVKLDVPQDVDPLGFDKSAKVKFSQPKGLSLQYIPRSQEMTTLGGVIASSAQSISITLGDIVFIAPSETYDLEIGKKYTITREPYETNYGRGGYSYSNIGSVRVIRRKNGVYIARVVDGSHSIERGDLVVDYVPKMVEPDPVEGPEPVVATIDIDPQLSTFATSQFKQILIDRGTADGVRPGMIFRAYLDNDPVTEDHLAASGVFPLVEVKILKSDTTISTGVVLSGDRTIERGDRVILITDLETLDRKGDEELIDIQQSAEEEFVGDEEYDDIESLLVAPDDADAIEDLDEIDQEDASALGTEEAEYDDSELGDDELLREEDELPSDEPINEEDADDAQLEDDSEYEPVGLEEEIDDEPVDEREGDETTENAPVEDGDPDGKEESLGAGDDLFEDGEGGAAGSDDLIDVDLDQMGDGSTSSDDEKSSESSDNGNSLDGLDAGGKLKASERKELQQLESWESNQEAETEDE